MAADPWEIDRLALAGYYEPEAARLRVHKTTRTTEAKTRYHMNSGYRLTTAVGPVLAALAIVRLLVFLFATDRSSSRSRRPSLLASTQVVTTASGKRIRCRTLCWIRSIQVTGSAGGDHAFACTAPSAAHKTTQLLAQTSGTPRAATESNPHEDVL